MRMTALSSFTDLFRFCSPMKASDRRYPCSKQGSNLRSCFARLLSLGLATLFGFVLMSSAASSQSVPKSSGKSPRSDSAKISDESLLTVKRKQDVENIRSFAELISSFKKADGKARALAQLADILWDYDQTYSRHLFTNAIDLIKPEAGASPSEKQALRRLHSEILSLIAKRDADLAKRLMDQASSPVEADEAEKTRTNFEIAYEAAKTQPDKSVEFAQRTLQSGIPLSMSFLLAKLREKDEAAADKLFLLALQRLYLESAVDADTLLALGTYIFTSPSIDPSLPASSIFYAGVGNVLVADIGSDRPNIPRGLVIAYMKTAADCLNHPFATAEQHAKMYAAGYQLLPKAYRYAPELTSPIAAAMQWLSQDVPPEMMKEETYKNLKGTGKKDLSENLRDIEKNPDSEYRDARYLAVIYDLWRQADFTEAASVNDKVSDIETRSKISSLIDFGRGARLLEKDGRSLAEVENICVGLPPGLERAVLRLGIAKARARNHESTRIVEAINEAVGDINKVDSIHRAYLLLNAAGLSADYAPMLAPPMLSEAVKQFKSEQGDKFDVTWNERVEAGVMWREFPLSVKDLNFDVSASLRSLVKIDPQGTVVTVRTLTNEDLLTRMLPALASGMLH